MASASSTLEDAFSCLMTATNPNDPQAATNRENAVHYVNEALSAPTAGRNVFAVLARTGSLQIRFQCLSALQQVVTRLAEHAMGDLQAMLHAARAALDRGEFPAQAPDPVPNSPQAELEVIHGLLWPWVDSNLDQIARSPPFFVNKVAVVLAMLFKFLYPCRWRSAPLDALGFVQRGESGVVMFLRLLYHVDDEIIRSHVGAGTQSLQLHAALLKDSMRVQCVGELAQAWQTILATYIYSRPDIVVQCLRTMQLFVHWIDVHLVANDTFVPLFHRLLASPSAAVRGRACNCLARLVGKGMDKGSKLALIHALQLPQAVEPLGAEAVRRAAAGSPASGAEDDSPSGGGGEEGEGDSDTAAEVWLGQLVMQLGTELHDVATAEACDPQARASALTLFRRTALGVAMDLARSPRPAVTSCVSEVLVLVAGLAKKAPQAMEAAARAIAESGAQAVVDAAEAPADLDARVEATVHGDGPGGAEGATPPSLQPSTQWLVEAYVRLLSAFVRMIRYPPEYRFEDGLVDANEDFERMRGTAVRCLHNAVQACPTGALAFAAQLFRTRELAPEALAQQPARVVEGALQFVAQAGQRVDLKPFVGKDQPFGMAVAALIGSSAAYHPAPAVAKAYFQTIVANFSAVLAAPELLPPLLQQLVGETGLRHPSRLVRHRCAFNVKETVRKASKVVGPHVNPLLQSIAPLLKIPEPVAMGENVEARAYRPSDLLMLFQTVGLVAGNATVEMESRKAALAIAGAPLRDQLTGAAQEASRILSGGADLATQARIGAWIAQAIDCAFYVIKGIVHMAPELGGDISALLDASLQAAGAMPRHSEVRQKISNLMLNVTPRAPADVMAPRLPAVVQFLASTSPKPFLLQEPLTLMQQALSHQEERVHASLAPSIASLLPQALALELPPPDEDEGGDWNARTESAKLACGLIGQAVQSGASPHVFAAVGAAELDRALDLVYRRALQGPDSVARAAIHTFSALVVAYLADARSASSLPLPGNVKRPAPVQAPEQLRSLLLERVSSYGATLPLEVLSQAWFEPKQPPCVIAARDGAVLLHIGRRCFPAKLAAALESRVFPSMRLPQHVAQEVMAHVGNDEPRALAHYLVSLAKQGRGIA